MKRVLLALLCLVIVEGLALAGPYIVCYEIQPSGQMNYWGQPVYCARIVGYKEWERDSYNAPVFDGRRVCPRGSIQRVYDSYHNIGLDVDLCP